MLNRVERLLERLVKNGEIVVSDLNEAFALLEVLKKDRKNALRSQKAT